MATNSNISKFSLKRLKTPQRRQGSSPRSHDTTPTRKSPSIISDMDKRYRTKRSRSRGRYRDRTWDSHRPLKTARSDSSIRRTTSYSRHSGDSPKIVKKESSERRREDSTYPSRHLSRSYSKTYENRREESRRHVPGGSRARSGFRDEEFYDPVESNRNHIRIPVPEKYKCQSRLVIRPPPAIAVPRPGWIHLPVRLVPPRPPQMRLPFPARVVRGVAPVVVTPVVVLGPPMMPLRPPVPLTTNRLC